MWICSIQGMFLVLMPLLCASSSVIFISLFPGTSVHRHLHWFAESSLIALELCFCVLLCAGKKSNTLGTHSGLIMVPTMVIPDLQAVQLEKYTQVNNRKCQKLRSTTMTKMQEVQSIHPKDA